MDSVPTYEEDILAWPEHQAGLLRGLKAGAGLPDDLDLENIAEEVEAMGRSELPALESQLVDVLVHAVKATATPGADAAPHWLDGMGVFQQAAPRAFAPSMRQRLDLPLLWRRAVRLAERSLRRYGETPPPLPADCPFTLDRLLDDSVELETVVARLLPG